MVGVRFVKCDDLETLSNIIKFNNSQNRIEAADFRSSDPVQERLRMEFREIPGVRYLGGRRGGADDIIRRPGDLLPSTVAAQALTAFHQHPVIAYNEKSEIWESDTYYARIFNEQTTARHVLFCYSLLKAIESRRQELREKDLLGKLRENEVAQLDFLRGRGAVFLFVSAVAKALETLANRRIDNPFLVSFDRDKNESAAERLWSPVIGRLLPLHGPLGAAIKDGLKNAELVRKGVIDFIGLVEATTASNEVIYRTFVASLSFS